MNKIFFEQPPRWCSCCQLTLPTKGGDYVAFNNGLNRKYEEGWSDCKENYSHQQFSPARTESLLDMVKELQKDNKLFKKKLALATKLLRYAQSTIYGAQGQFDRFFEEGCAYDGEIDA